MLFRIQYLLTFSYVYFAFLATTIETSQKAKDNGDIYIVKEETMLKDIQDKMQTETTYSKANNNIGWGYTTGAPQIPNLIDWEELIATCNSSFYIPMQYFMAFNTTAELPDLVDKTGMCFIRCLFEKSGFIENWKLNAEKIRVNIWPAMGDTLEVCEQEGAEEKNACVRAYAMAKCLTIRCLVDARNKPV